MSVTQPVPSRQAFLVEFPGYVSNPDAVVRTLGGIDALTTAANSDHSVLQLRFRPDDPYAHPLYGERQAARGLVLKLARKVADPGQEGVKAEILACVHSKFTFSGMADYQYLPVDSSKSGTASCSSVGPYGEETQPMLCIPPLFTKADVPLDYAFKNFRASDRPASSKAKSPPWLVPITSQEVPAQVGTSQGLEPTQGKALEAHLNARPVWTQASLAHEMPDAAQADLELLCQKLCYQFKEGPWKGAWIRRGHDPRTDQDSWRYQALQYDLPLAWYEKAIAKQGIGEAAQGSGQGQADATVPTEGTAASYEAIHRCEALPISQSTLFLLCDFAHPEVCKMLQQCTPAADCNEKSGWLSQAEWDRVVEKVTELFSRHMS